ncbi:MAG: glycosyltransferase, partial [Myxococcales bacterium]
LAVMLASDVFVRPTYADGDALSVREALSLGRPVVASAVGFRPEGTTLFRTGDALDLAEKVERALGARQAQPVPAAQTSGVLGVYRQVLGLEDGYSAETPRAGAAWEA